MTTAVPHVIPRFRIDPDYVPTFEAKLFIEGPSTARRLVNFFSLLLFATVIATYGVLSDSTATVIGAMIVAPLMGPIMATTAGVIMGSVVRAGRALALVGVGVLTVIVFSYVLSLIVPSVIISFTSNREITSRVSPGLLALLTALASGAAGAFIVAREEIADSMGGVAIAISLVPPLCVVGISLSQGHWQEAQGASLLFVTNFVAILLAGGLVLWLSGLNEVGEAGVRRRFRRGGFAVIVIATLLVAIPLTLTARKVLVDARDTIIARSATLTWLRGTSLDLLSVEVDGDMVATAVAGTDEPPDPNVLATRLASALGRPVVVDLHVVRAADFTVPGEPANDQ
jgi:uncharacterized hydrophobic protein (TIGR00271 family)